MTSANYTYLAIGIAAGIYLIVYLFKAAGLSKMAVNAGKKKLAWCAFVPFASTYLMGELAGEMRFGNARFKKIGLVAMIAEILYTASLAVFFVPQNGKYKMVCGNCKVAESDSLFLGKGDNIVELVRELNVHNIFICENSNKPR